MKCKWQDYYYYNSKLIRASQQQSNDISKHVLASQKNIHYYTNFTGGGRFRFPAAGKAVRRGLDAMVNRGLTAAGGFARRG